MPDYSNGKIYKITTEKGCYVGCTTMTLSARLSGHLTQLKRALKGKSNYCASFEVMHDAKEKIEIALVENFPCENKKALMAREAEVIRGIECVNWLRTGENKAVKTPLHQMIYDLTAEHRKHRTKCARDNYAKYVAPYRQREKELREREREYNHRLLTPTTTGV